MQFPHPRVRNNDTAKSQAYYSLWNNDVVNRYASTLGDQLSAIALSI